MKKLSILTLSTLFLLTGCGKARLVCTQTTTASNFSLESKYTFTFDGETVKKATMKSTGTITETDTEDEDIDISITDYEAAAESAADDYNEVEGITATVSSHNNKVTLTVEVDSSKLSDDDKEDYGMNLTKEEIKETLEEAGYTCK